MTFAVLLAATAMFVTSCSEDDEEGAGASKTCVCVEYDSDNDRQVGSSMLDPASWGATNCPDLGIKLSMQNYDKGLYYECR